MTVFNSSGHTKLFNFASSLPFHGVVAAVTNTALATWPPLAAWLLAKLINRTCPTHEILI